MRRLDGGQCGLERGMRRMIGLTKGIIRLMMRGLRRIIRRIIRLTTQLRPVIRYKGEDTSTVVTLPSPAMATHQGLG